MSFVQAVIVLVIILSVNLLINRIATVALVLTGMSRDMARFQARSAFCTVGFTTSEAESIANHPLRRRIIMILMLAGNIGFVSIIVAGVSSIGGSATMPTTAKILLLIGVFAVLFLVASSKWLDDIMFRLISWAIKRFSGIEIVDFHALLRMQEGYYVMTLAVEEEDWLVGRSLNELRLSDMGVNVLSINRIDGVFVGSPVGSNYVRNKDTLILYGTRESIEYLDNRRGKEEGWRQHQEILGAKEQYLKAHPESEIRSNISQLVVNEDSWLIGCALSSLGTPEAGLVFLAIEHQDGSYQTMPSPGYVILPYDRLFCFCTGGFFYALSTAKNIEMYEASTALLQHGAPSPAERAAGVP